MATLGKKVLNDLVADPQFLNLNLIQTEGDFHLKSTSPAIDSGTNNLFAVNDIEKRNRPLGSNIDMGAYEFDPTTSLFELKLSNPSIHVYPNPASSVLNIDYDTAPYVVVVFNSLGNLVQSDVSDSPSFNMNVGQLKKGLYLIRIQDNENNTITKKVIIE